MGGVFLLDNPNIPVRKNQQHPGVSQYRSLRQSPQHQFRDNRFLLDVSPAQAM
jgi:hypothetical protein